MKEEDFENIKNTCDQILIRFQDNHIIIANAWLHVLNVHPNSIERYTYLFRKHYSLSYLSRLAKNLLNVCYQLIRSFVEQRLTVKKAGSYADVLFISHMVNSKISDSQSDFYYGDLPLIASENRRLTVVTGMINHTSGLASYSLKEKLINSKSVKYLFPRTLPFINELKNIFKCIKAFLILAGTSFKEKDPFVKKILREAALQSFDPETFYTLRIYENIQALIKQLQPPNLVITWEGRAWERLAILAARQSEVVKKCIGYQHTILLSSSHSIKRPLGTKYDPDVILTLGEITGDILRKSMINTSFCSYGSYRLELPDTSENKDRSKVVCLVAPEGLAYECLLLFGMAVKAANKNPEFHFVFRTHPVFTYEMFCEKYPSFRSLPPNCIISDFESLADDLKRCNCILYRGSSVALYAVINGIKPFYLADNELLNDSLFFIEDWKEKVDDVDQLLNGLRAFTQMTDDTFDATYKQASAECRKYVIKPDESVFFDNLYRTF